MIYVNDKKFSELEPNQRIAYCKNNLIDPTLSERRFFDWKWYWARCFQAGDQYKVYNTTTNQIENPPARRGAVRLVINFVKAHTRAVKNFITSSDPKFEVLPGDIDPQTVNNAVSAGKILDYLQRQKLYMFPKIRIAVDDIVDTSVSFFELGWDAEAEKGLGQITLTVHDPFEILIPLTALVEGPVIHAPFIAKTISRSIDEIKNDERYDEKTRKEVKPDNELAASQIKAKILRKQGVKTDRPEGLETAMVYEVMLWDAEGNSKDGKVNIYTFAGDQELRNEETDLTEFPIYALQDEPRRTLYGESPLTYTLIPPQSALNRLESQDLENNNNLMRPTIKAERGHGVNFNATGRASGNEIEVIEVNPGRSVEFWQKPSLTDRGQAQRMAHYIEVLSGVPEAMYGLNPAGGRSGSMLEQLQAAGANNLAGLQMSLLTFLEIVGSRILDIVADKYVASRVAKIAGPEGQETPVRVVGERAPAKPEGAVIINKDNELMVKIGSWLGYTKEAQRDALLKLNEQGIVDTETVLRNLDIPNVDVVAQKAREERLEEHELKAEIAGRRGEGVAPTPQAGLPVQAMGGMAPDVQLADEENVRMMNGEVLPPTPNASVQHSQAHLDWAQSPDAQQNPRVVQVVLQHARGELQAQGLPAQAGIGGGQNV